MDAAFLVLFFLVGLIFGSFGNVVIARVPEGASVARPRSACPGCGTPISVRDNIPLVSWLVLRGRCRACGDLISWRYPAVELVTGLLFAGIGARFAGDVAILPFLLFGWVLIVVSVIDARTRRIPNRIIYPLTPVLFTLLMMAGVAEGHPGAAVRSLLGGLAAFGALLLLALMSPAGMGMGDVKLAGFLGLGLGYLGWGQVLLGIFAGFLLGGVVAVVLLALRIRRRKDLIPFGPYLAAGGLLAVFAGQAVLDVYGRAVGLS